MLYSIVKKSGSLREVNKIKNIKPKASEKRSYSIRYSFRIGLDYYSSLSTDSDLDEDIQPTELKEINRLYNVLINNIKKNNNQHNDAIENEPKFNNIFSLSIGTKDPLPVVTFSIRGGKKQISSMVDGLTLLWNSRATNSVIKIKHTKNY